MKLAIVAGGFTPDDADKLRRAMAAWKRKGDLIHRFGEKLIGGMLANGYDPDFAARCFEQIKGFSEYGFPESHAASFALLVYVSCYLKHYYPAAFAAALLNSQPMGFYQPAQIIRDAKEHKVLVQPIDANASTWDCALERIEGGDVALRLGMRLAKGLGEEHANTLTDERDHRGPFHSMDDIFRRTGLPPRPLRALARADGFTSLGLDRQHALWSIQSRSAIAAPLLDSQEFMEPEPMLPWIAQPTLVKQDYDSTGLSLKAHPMSFIRPDLDAQGVTMAGLLADQAAWPHGKPIKVAGMVLVRQRPGTASGIVFVTLEDETGIANLIIRPKVFERFHTALRHSAYLLATGKVERAGEVVHVQVARAESLDEPVGDSASRSRDFH